MISRNSVYTTFYYPLLSEVKIHKWRKEETKRRWRKKAIRNKYVKEIGFQKRTEFLMWWTWGDILISPWNYCMEASQFVEAPKFECNLAPPP